MFVPVIPAGTDAPGFELPGLIDGARRRVALDEFVGQDVVILAFYPADFNPACGADSDLDELDLFTMQKDVEVLAIGPDTLYSHAAFADEYGLHIPLLSDTNREVAETYGVAFEDDVGQRLVERAVFVIDHDGVIQYAWSTRDMTELPRSEEIKDAIADTGGDDTAFARYRVGHAHYIEGRRAFTSAMASYRDSEWMVAQSDFQRAREEFEEAADHFDSAARFVDDETLGPYYERTQEKATALWQAADWLSQSASEYSSGRGAEGQRLRDDAERPLENARDLGDPIDPDEWPPEDDDDERESILPQDEGSQSKLTVDIDDEVAENAARDGDGEGGSGSGDEAGGGMGDGSETGDGSTSDGTSSTREDEIDDAELEKIEAELTASQPDDPEGEELEETPTSMVDAPPARESESPAEGDEDIHGEVGDEDLKALEAEMEASQSAADAANGSDDGDGEESAEDGDQAPVDDSGDGVEGESSDGAVDESPADGPADPHADLASGGSSVPGASRSLEPAGEPGDSGDNQGSADGAGDETDEAAIEGDDGADESDDEPVLDDEPRGASDDDLANIPTAEDLAEDEVVGNEEDGDETGGEGGF